MPLTHFKNLKDSTQWSITTQRREKWFKEWSMPNNDSVSRTDQQATLNKVQEEVAQITKKHWGQEVKPLFCNTELLKLVRKVICKNKVAQQTLIELEDDIDEQEEREKLNAKIVEELADMIEPSLNHDDVQLCHFLLQGDHDEGASVKEAKKRCNVCNAVMCTPCYQLHDCEGLKEDEEDDEEEEEEDSEATKASRIKRKATDTDNDAAPDKKSAKDE